MEPSRRVCPFCGEPPGEGVFCAACGRNLAAVERLPTRAEWEGRAPAEDEPPERGAEQAERCTWAVADFLAAAAAAGNPGTAPFTTGKPGMFRRAPELDAWVVRPVDREDFEEPHRYEPGLALALDGRFHRLDSELRGWGQRDFPRYEHTASPEPVDVPASDRLLAEVQALSRAVLGA